MKFSIDKHYLIDPLKQVALALPSKAIIPILSGILFVANEHGLTMTAGNSQVYISAVIDPDDLEINKHGSIVLPGSKVLEIVQKSGSDITFEAKGMEVTIKSGSNKFKLTGIDDEDFPEIPDIAAESVSLQGDAFKKIVRKTIFATAVEKSSTPILTGVNFEFSEGKVRATATDRHRMARTEISADSTSEFSTVISKESLNILLKIVPDNENIEFKFGIEGFITRTKGLTFFSRVLEGTYPNIDRAISFDFQLKAGFKTRSMLSALENVEIIAKEEKIHKAKVTITDEMLIESNTSGGDAAVSVELTEVNGEGVVVSFNVTFVIEALKAIESEQTHINFNGKLAPMILQGTDDTNSIYVVLPYRTQES